VAQSNRTRARGSSVAPGLGGNDTKGEETMDCGREREGGRGMELRLALGARKGNRPKGTERGG